MQNIRSNLHQGFTCSPGKNKLKSYALLHLFIHLSNKNTWSNDHRLVLLNDHCIIRRKML